MLSLGYSQEEHKLKHNALVIGYLSIKQVQIQLAMWYGKG